MFPNGNIRGNGLLGLWELRHTATRTATKCQRMTTFVRVSPLGGAAKETKGVT